MYIKNHVEDLMSLSSHTYPSRLFEFYGNDECAFDIHIYSFIH